MAISNRQIISDAWVLERHEQRRSRAKNVERQFFRRSTCRERAYLGCKAENKAQRLTRTARVNYSTSERFSDKSITSRQTLETLPHRGTIDLVCLLPALDGVQNRVAYGDPRETLSLLSVAVRNSRNDGRERNPARSDHSLFAGNDHVCKLRVSDIPNVLGNGQHGVVRVGGRRVQGYSTTHRASIIMTREHLPSSVGSQAQTITTRKVEREGQAGNRKTVKAK